MARIPMEFNLLEWQDIKQQAKAMNIRPTEYIKDALISLAASVKEGQV